MNSLGQQVPNMLPEISGEITPEKIKRWSKSKNNTQLWKWLGQNGNDTQLCMCLVVKVKSDAVKNNIAQEPGMLGP